jgi:hypothetical protein
MLVSSWKAWKLADPKLSLNVNILNKIYFKGNSFWKWGLKGEILIFVDIVAFFFFFYSNCFWHAGIWLILCTSPENCQNVQWPFIYYISIFLGFLIIGKLGLRFIGWTCLNLFEYYFSARIHCTVNGYAMTSWPGCTWLWWYIKESGTLLQCARSTPSRQWLFN